MRQSDVMLIMSVWRSLSLDHMYKVKRNITEMQNDVAEIFRAKHRSSAMRVECEVRMPPFSDHQVDRCHLEICTNVRIT